MESTTTSVLVNGSPCEEFHLKKGLRQGDPLSPFLFILAAEGLSLLTKRACDENLLKPALIGDLKVPISHLQYADDVVFLCSKDKENLKIIQRTLRLFEIISGLKVNFGKSKLYGPCVPENELIESANLLGCDIERGQFLGMRIGVNNRRKSSWSWLIQKVKNRIARWDGNDIAMGGRATLVQSVLSSIPIYTLSFHLLPKKTILELIRIQRAFLWGGNVSNSKIAWVSWSEICKSECEGGLGIRDLECFNKALLAKWVWSLLEEKERLWAKILYSKYGGLEESRRIVEKERGYLRTSN